MSHFSDDQNFREIAENEILQPAYWPGSNVLPYLSWDRTKLKLSLHLIRCCSTSLHKASVCPQHKPFSRLPYRIALVWILDISCLPVVRNIESNMKNTKLKGKAAHYWGPSFLLNSHLLWSCSSTCAHTRTRLELGSSKSLRHSNLHIARILSPQHHGFGVFFFSLQIHSCFAT